MIIIVKDLATNNLYQIDMNQNVLKIGSLALEYDL